MAKTILEEWEPIIGLAAVRERYKQYYGINDKEADKTIRDDLRGLKERREDYEKRVQMGYVG